MDIECFQRVVQQAARECFCNDGSPQRNQEVDSRVRAAIRAMAFLEKASVQIKKISVSKKAPNRCSTYSHLNHLKLWGYPKVFLSDGDTTIQTLHEFFLSPYKCTYEPVPADGGYKQIFQIDVDKPSVPPIFTFAGYSPQGLPSFSFATHQYEMNRVGAWLIENCPRLLELDRQVQAEWKKQSESFEKEAERYIEKLGGKQRVHFQNKLAKQLLKNRYEMRSMSATSMYELFKFARDHEEALQGLVNFCKRNRADAAFVDESDMREAMRLVEVELVMGE